MHSKIRLTIKTNTPHYFTFHPHPQMTVRQLSQLLLASKILHQQSNQTQGWVQIPVALGSCDNNLLIDYLLMSSQFSISRICHLSSQFNGARQLSIPPLNRSFCQKQISAQSFQTLDLRMIYKRVPKIKGVHQNVFSYIEGNFSRKDFTHQQSEVFSILRKIGMKENGCGFSQKQMIFKAVIKSYGELEKLMIIRDRLIRLSLHHIDIFGELEQISMNEDYFIFSFKYSPSVSLRQLTEIDLRQNQICTLANKIWMFINSLRLNGFEKVIAEQIQSKKLEAFLSKIRFTMNADLFINDLNVILEQQTSWNKKMSEEEERQLAYRIKCYVEGREIVNKIEKINNNLLDFSQGVRQEIGFYEFISVFRKQKYQYTHQQQSDHLVLTTFFQWKKSQICETEQKVYQATTAKKGKRLNATDRDRKKRKDQIKSLKDKKRSKTKAKWTKVFNVSFFK